jgi:energy-coupling factor transporter ATP-binding protein EcfA2
MPDYPYHKQLRLQNFTVFRDTEFEFVPGVNAFIGKNGTGKTHLLKAIYAYQRPYTRSIFRVGDALRELFQVEDVHDIVRFDMASGAIAEVQGLYGDEQWNYAIQETGGPANVAWTHKRDTIRPIFIPAIDMMGHTKGFTQAYDQVSLDFDLTFFDLVTLFLLPRRETPQLPPQHPMAGASTIPDLPGLRQLLGGELELNQDTGRFYLQTTTQRIAMPMVAEGLRKIAALVRLQQNGWIVRGMTLFWDEPEVNINPILMGTVVQAILELARQDVQVFFTTHSYVMLKELDLQAKSDDAVRYFSLYPTENGTQSAMTDDFTSLEPNPILEEYTSLYDRELTRSTGRNRRGERVR